MNEKIGFQADFRRSGYSKTKNSLKAVRVSQSVSVLCGTFLFSFYFDFFHLNGIFMYF